MEIEQDLYNKLIAGRIFKTHPMAKVFLERKKVQLDKESCVALENGTAMAKYLQIAKDLMVRSITNDLFTEKE